MAVAASQAVQRHDAGCGQPGESDGVPAADRCRGIDGWDSRIATEAVQSGASNPFDAPHEVLSHPACLIASAPLDRLARGDGHGPPCPLRRSVSLDELQRLARRQGRLARVTAPEVRRADLSADRVRVDAATGLGRDALSFRGSCCDSCESVRSHGGMDLRPGARRILRGRPHLQRHDRIRARRRPQPLSVGPRPLPPDKRGSCARRQLTARDPHSANLQIGSQENRAAHDARLCCDDAADRRPTTTCHCERIPTEQAPAARSRCTVAA